MTAVRGLRRQILELRSQGFFYNQIAEKLNCSKGTISYHCQLHGKTDIGKKQKSVPLEIKKEIALYCQDHDIKEAVSHFKLSTSSIQKYRNFKG